MLQVQAKPLSHYNIMQSQPNPNSSHQTITRNYLKTTPEKKNLLVYLVEVLGMSINQSYKICGLGRTNAQNIIRERKQPKSMSVISETQPIQPSGCQEAPNTLEMGCLEYQANEETLIPVVLTEPFMMFWPSYMHNADPHLALCSLQPNCFGGTGYQGK